MYILGVNAYHGDSSAAMIRDGVVIAAAEEERFTRIKHWAGIPLNAIEYCLEYSGISLSEVSHVAINSDNSAHRWEKIAYILTSRPGLRLAIEKLRSRSKRNSLLVELEKQAGYQVGSVQLHNIEHHLCHLASAFYPSGYETSALLSIDGFGDFSSAAWGVGANSGISVLGYRKFPHSMGIFYQAITQYLGFPNYGDEYKVMGLASYGSPGFVSELREVLHTDKEGQFSLSLPFFRHHREALSYQWLDGIPRFDNLYSNKMEQLLGPARRSDQSIDQKHQDIAASAQKLYEEVLLSMLNRLHAETGADNLALAGGCAMNSVANGKILQNTKFSNIYVQPAAGDAGGAIGAALVVWRKLTGTFNDPVMPDAYLGPGYSDSEIESILQGSAEQLDNRDFKIENWRESELVQHIAGKIEGGAVVGWFQGRMEWGPRALGNRSILADPRRSDIQDLLNQKIKRRESFRPFAPSILSEQVGEWFEIVDQVPFMEKVYPIKPQKHDVIPAVTHVDGTGRLQTVDRDSNPRYYNLINAFYELTGVPILLNTSFNENEPIVCTPDQALQCFLRTRMDVLVLGNCTITRLNSE